MSADIPLVPKRPPKLALRLNVTSTATSSSSGNNSLSSASTSTTSSNSNTIPIISTSTTSTTSSISTRPKLKLNSISIPLSKLSLSIPSHYSTSLNQPTDEGNPSSSSSSESDSEESHKWKKGDQARMAFEIKEIIERPVGLEEDLAGKGNGCGGLRIERRVRSNSRVSMVRPGTGGSSGNSESESVNIVGNNKEEQTSLGPSGLRKEDSINATEEDVGILQNELIVNPSTLLDLGRLGEGASGEVRKVKHLPTGIIMAKKTIATSPNPKLHRQHLRELLFMRECYNPHIVQYYGAFLEENDSQIGICMEYCEGGSLEVLYKKVKENGWRTGEKVLGKIAESVLNGLVYLHDRKIIHRDIKPSNVLVSLDGQVKLCDFGVSGELINSLAGTFLGTIFYLSPERIKGGKYSINADVWSMTLTVLEVALNRYPFPAENEAPLTGPFELLTYLINMDSTPKLPDELDKGIKYTNAFRDFIKQGLDKDASTRPTPSKLLSHAWIRRSIERNPPADLGRWVKDLS